MQFRDYKMRMNSVEFIPPAADLSSSLSFSPSSFFHIFFLKWCAWENWQVCVKRDSIFTILFFISFLTFLEFKLEKSSRFHQEATSKC